MSLRVAEMAGRVAKTVRRLRRVIWTSTSADWYRVRLADRSADDNAVPNPPGVTVAFDQPAVVTAWLAELASQFRWVYVHEELDSAARCRHPLGLLRVHGRPAGYIKVGIEQAFVTDLGRRLMLPPGVAFIYDTFVHPDYRGRGLAAVLVRRTMCELSARNVHSVWCHIPRWNKPSIRTYMRAGFQRAGHIRQFRLAGLRFATAQPESLLWADIKNDLPGHGDYSSFAKSAD